MGYFGAICLGMVLAGHCAPVDYIDAQYFGLDGVGGIDWGRTSPYLSSTVALVSTQISALHIGAGMGLIGTLKNAGKVVGPILGGFLIGWLDFSPMFWSMGLLLLLGAGVVGYWGQRRQTQIHSPHA